MTKKEAIYQEDRENMDDFCKKLKEAGLFNHPAFNRIWNVICAEADGKPDGEGGDILRLSEDLFWANEAIKH